MQSAQFKPQTDNSPIELSSLVWATANTDMHPEYAAVIEFFDVTEGTPSVFPAGTESTGFLKVTSFQFTTAAVPEPSSLLLFGLGMATLARRRRKLAC